MSEGYHSAVTLPFSGPNILCGLMAPVEVRWNAGNSANLRLTLTVKPVACNRYRDQEPLDWEQAVGSELKAREDKAHVTRTERMEWEQAIQ
jgi:hypothetical protein